METIMLASGSPRRQEYFKMMGIPFSILPAIIDEGKITEKDPFRRTAELAVKKVQNVIEVMNNRLPKWICGADTVIAIDNKIFGKPASREEASQMLLKLSGMEHNVITSIALYNGNNKSIDCRTSSCTVNFARLTEEEIEWYLNTNEWQGVAGAYRIQGLGACLINDINGAPSTVAGLPLREFYVMLKDNGYQYGEE
jgi:septum formation protein